jgi:HD superfamily phosphodiesterase
MKNFKEKVRSYYKPYYDKGDPAHQIDHADSVCDLALEINQKCDEKLVILASYIHDMFNATNRAKHNELAYYYVLEAEDKFLQELSTEEILQVAHAVLEHRGSFKGSFYSLLSAIISSADRGLPDLDFIVIRSMKFNNEDAFDVVAHIHDKYGKNGYGNYPDVYKNIFKEELEAFHKLADELTVDRVLEIWKQKKDIK